MNAIDVLGVSKTFKSRGEVIKALDDVSLNIKKGEIFGLLGPNGAGKTTLLNIMTGVLIHDKGEIKVFGRALDRQAFEKMNYVSLRSTCLNRAVPDRGK